MRWCGPAGGQCSWPRAGAAESERRRCWRRVDEARVGAVVHGSGASDRHPGLPYLPDARTCLAALIPFSPSPRALLADLTEGRAASLVPRCIGGLGAGSGHAAVAHPCQLERSVAETPLASGASAGAHEQVLECLVLGRDLEHPKLLRECRLEQPRHGLAPWHLDHQIIVL
jgi:hypothetical protein